VGQVVIDSGRSRLQHRAVVARHVICEASSLAALGEVDHRFEFLSVRAPRTRLDQQHTVVWLNLLFGRQGHSQREQRKKGQCGLRIQFSVSLPPGNVGPGNINEQVLVRLQ
jgi:hypothetical protein